MQSLPHLKAFEGLFTSLSYRYGYERVFDDFLDLVICCFAMQRYEEQYFEIIGRYEKRHVEIFPKLLAELTLVYDKLSESGAWCDPLGDFFESNTSNFGKSAMGQFFTPEHVCTLMAELQGNPKGRINDPACGSGRCLIAIDRLDPQNRFDNFYVAQDLDSRCVRMCAINFVMYGMKGAVIHMDSLGLKIYGGYRVYLPETGLGVQKMSVQECESHIYERKKKAEAPEVVQEVLPVEAPAVRKTNMNKRLLEILNT